MITWVFNLLKEVLFCVVDERDVLVWGFGTLGVGPNVTSSTTPQVIPPTLFGRNELAPEKLVKDLTCGINHFAATTSRYFCITTE